MRILMVARRFPPDVLSGTETVFARLYREARARHEVQLVAGYRQRRELVPAEAIAVDLRGKGAGAWPAMARAAGKAAKDFRPDVVLSNSIEVRPAGVPCVTIVHDLNFGRAERGLSTRARELFYRVQASSLAAVVAVSAHTRDRLVGIGVPASRIVVIHNGVDLPDPSPREPEGVVRFVHVSRVLPGKGQHASIDAIGRVRPDLRRGMRLAIVGTVADRIYADQLRVQAFGQPVDFHFDVPEVAPFYAGADVALFPTLMEEGFGFGAVEAMAAGRPVIFYDQPAVREATGGHAVAVPRDDANALRDAMVRLAGNPDERLRLGREGRAFVERYRWERVWAQYEGVLEDVR